MKLVLVVVAAMAACSCASAPKTAAMPDGRVAQMAYCDGGKDSFASCFNQAAEQCGGPYEIVSQTSTSDFKPRREVAFICKP